MTDEIFGLMECFPGSYINRFGEIILSEKGNVYFTAKNCTDKEDIICKLLEWCSRPMAKGEPYSSHKRNNEWREQLYHVTKWNRFLDIAEFQMKSCRISRKTGKCISVMSLFPLTISIIQKLQKL